MNSGRVRLWFSASVLGKDEAGLQELACRPQTDRVGKEGKQHRRGVTENAAECVGLEQAYGRFGGCDDRLGDRLDGQAQRSTLGVGGQCADRFEQHVGPPCRAARITAGHPDGHGWQPPRAEEKLRAASCRTTNQPAVFRRGRVGAGSGTVSRL
ncbi:hypothetical protein GTS_54140 [Gandjariella thermophila]|uniref:Uncharacterized protein n=1 Tax=Gandjariella thermophila TaxID=1931992 RepID=A0A4D4JAU3_9PSEU|nr:hypothetical protein GTS_54140 [Gandjariella thermophila]